MHGNCTANQVIIANADLEKRLRWRFEAGEHRHLTQDGTSFRQILQARRRTAIEAILSSNGARLADLAGSMSYSDSAVLSRAFKSWTGMSPRAYARSRKR